jgi:hypothetical protein
VKAKTGIALSLTTIVVLALATVAQSNASNALAITPYWQGRYDGEANGKADNRDGFSYDASCNFNLSDDYCGGYKLGYFIVWAQGQLLHR